MPIGRFPQASDARPVAPAADRGATDLNAVRPGVLVNFQMNPRQVSPLAPVMMSHTFAVSALALVFIGTTLPGQWGGAWGGRGIGPRRLAKRSPNKLQPVLRAQQWLVSIQREDGSFAPSGDKAPSKPARAIEQDRSKNPIRAVDR